MNCIKRETRVTDLGDEQRCTRCGEWWPADEEFFHRYAGGLTAHCRACQAERCAASRQRERELAARGCA